MTSEELKKMVAENEEIRKQFRAIQVSEKQRADLAFLNNSSAIYSGLNSRKFIN